MYVCKRVHMCMYMRKAFVWSVSLANASVAKHVNVSLYFETQMALMQL